MNLHLCFALYFAVFVILVFLSLFLALFSHILFLVQEVVQTEYTIVYRFDIQLSMVGLWQLIVMFTWPFLCTFLSLVHVTWQYLSMISGGYPRCLFHHVFQWSDSQMLSNAARNSWFFSLIQEFGNLFVTALVQTLALHECIKYTF